MDLMKNLQTCKTLTAELIVKKILSAKLNSTTGEDSISENPIKADIARFEKEILALEKARDQTVSTLSTFLSSIEDMQLYIFIRLHYIYGFTWDEVALLTGASSRDAVSTRIYKYLRGLDDDH